MDHSFLRAARGGNLPKTIEFINSGVGINVCNSVGLTALHFAAKEGFDEIVQELILRGANLEAVTSKGNTPLHVASLAGRCDCVRLLINAGANVNSQSVMGFTPLYTAAQEDHLKVAELLLKNGANQALATEDGFTPLAVALQQGHERVVAMLLERDSKGRGALPALHTAARKDDVNAADLLLTNPEVSVNQQSQNGFTPLHVASHYGNVNVARLLIDRQANVNFQAKNNITPLHIAAKWGRIDASQLLLKSGALVDCRTRDGLTPLHCAARSGHTQLASLLMDSGANPCAKTKNGLTPLHMAAQGDHPDMAQVLILRGANVGDKTGDMLTPLHVAAHCGNVRVGKTLLAEGCDINTRALNGFTPLHIACKKQKLDIVHLLLSYGVKVNVTTESGMTALHVAAFMGNNDIVALLLQNGAMVDQATMRCETALHLAARNCKLEVAQTLVEHGALVDAREKEDRTPLHMAVMAGYVDMINFLLSVGADPHIATRDGYTTLHTAAKEGHADVVRLLIDIGVSPVLRTKKDFISLHLAAKRGRVKTARLLLQAQPDSLHAVGLNELTSLHIAAHYNHLPLVELLLDAGADAGAKASNGYTALHIAAKQNHIDVAALILARESHDGQSANSESRNGFTPLHLAAQEGHIDMVSLLIQHGADPNHKSNNGLTPLHLAAQDNHVPVAQILISQGADLSPMTRAGYTPLHTACHFGQLEAVRYLLSLLTKQQSAAEAIDKPTQLGFTPLHLATQQGHSQVVMLLLEHGANVNIRNKQGLTPAHIARKQHFVAIFDVLKTITTTVTSWDEELEELDQTLEQDHPDFMRDHTFADSDGEAVPSPLAARKAPFPLVVSSGASPDDIDGLSPTGMSGTLGLDHTYASLQENDDIWKQLEYTHSTLIEGEGAPSDLITPNMTSSLEAPPPTSATIPPSMNSFKDTSNQLMTSEHTEPTADWELEAENVEIVRKPVTAGFLVSFLLDACGGLAQSTRYPDLRFFVSPNAVEGPTRIVCRLVHPSRMPGLPPINDGDGFACRLMEFGPVGTRFNVPIVIEIPHYAYLQEQNRELIILRSDNGETWKEHPLDATDQAVRDSLRPHFENVESTDTLRSRSVHRILTSDLPQFFAIVTRIRQDLILIGPDGGKLSSHVEPQVFATFPQGALTKKIRVGLQVHMIDPDSDLVSRLLKPSVSSCSPIVTIEPRRRKFHKPITLTMPLPSSAIQHQRQQQQTSSSKSKNDANALSPSLRLLCSITGGTAPTVWEDISGTSSLSPSNGSVSFTTTVSARLWLIDCQTHNTNVVDLANRIYRESLAVPYFARFVVYGRRHHAEEAMLRCLCVTDDPVEKTLESLEGFKLLATGPPVQINDDHPHWIETAGNFVPVAKADEQLQLNSHAFRENRLTLIVRLKDTNRPGVGKLAFMNQPHSVVHSHTSGPLPKAVTVLEIELPVFTGNGSSAPAAVLETTDIDAVPAPTVDSEKPAPLREINQMPQPTYILEDTPLPSIKPPGRHDYGEASDSDYLARSNIDLRLIASRLGHDWMPVASKLGLSSEDINDIEESNRSHDACAYAALLYWQEQNKSPKSGTILARVLCDLGRRDIVESCMEEVVPVVSDSELDIAKQSIQSAEKLSMLQQDPDDSTTSGLGPSLSAQPKSTDDVIVPHQVGNGHVPTSTTPDVSPVSHQPLAPGVADAFSDLMADGDDDNNSQVYHPPSPPPGLVDESPVEPTSAHSQPRHHAPDLDLLGGVDHVDALPELPPIVEEIVPVRAARCGDNVATWGFPQQPTGANTIPPFVVADDQTQSAVDPVDSIIEPTYTEQLGLRESTWGRPQGFPRPDDMRDDDHRS